MVAVTSLPVWFTWLPVASAVALRYWSLSLVNNISFFRIILINNLTQREGGGALKKRVPKMLTNMNDPNNVVNGISMTDAFYYHNDRRILLLYTLS